MTKGGASGKEPPTEHYMLLCENKPRPQRGERAKRASSSHQSRVTRSVDHEDQDECRTAVQNFMMEQSYNASDWCATEAIFMMVIEGQLEERLGIWIFPKQGDRLQCGGPDSHFFVYARLEQSEYVVSLSCGIAVADECAVPAVDIQEPSVDLQQGYVVRIISVERAQKELPLVNTTISNTRFMQDCQHVQNVVLKEVKNCEPSVVDPDHTYHTRFKVLRTKAYVEAKQTVSDINAPHKKWEEAMGVLESEQVYGTFPWTLYNTVCASSPSEYESLLTALDHDLLADEGVEIDEETVLVSETLPTASYPLAVSEKRAAQKASQSTSIPEFRIFEPVIVPLWDDAQISETVTLVCHWY